jgi:hypothetical protein
MNKLTKYILIAMIVAVGIFVALQIISWMIVQTILEIIELFTLISLL